MEGADMDIRPEDVRILVELANTVEDHDPDDIAALERVQDALVEHERETSAEQEQAFDDDSGLGIGD
jgi:hypothetical protein